MKSLRLMLIDAADTTPQYLPLNLLPNGEAILVEHAASALGIKLTLDFFEPDLVLSEFSLETLQSMQALEVLHELRPGLPLIIVSDRHDEQLVLRAVVRGAFDCVPKHDRTRLLIAMTHALNASRERRLRAKAERSLQESEMRFRIFMEQVPDAIYMKDLEGRFTFVNSVAKRIIGLSAGQIIGKTLHQLYPSDVANRLDANDKRALLVRQPVETTEQVDTPTGQRVFRSVRFPIIGMDGQVTMTGGVSVDIGQRSTAVPERVAAR